MPSLESDWQMALELNPVLLGDPAFLAVKADPLNAKMIFVVGYAAAVGRMAESMGYPLEYMNAFSQVFQEIDGFTRAEGLGRIKDA